MRPNMRVLLVALVVLVAVVAAIVWTTRSNAPVPDFQNRVGVPGQDAHVVSLWLEPSSPGVGPVELTTQIGDPTGMPITATNVEFYFFPAGGFPEDALPTAYTDEAPTQDFLGRGHGYVATHVFSEAGVWSVEVRFELQGNERSTIFEIEIED